MSSLDDHPHWCPKHGFTNVIRPGSQGVGAIPREDCPWCALADAEATIDRVKTAVFRLTTYNPDAVVREVRDVLKGDDIDDRAIKKAVAEGRGARVIDADIEGSER